jgi:hypothetical protein
MTATVATAEVEKRIWQWRHLMEYFLIKRYQTCIDALQGGSDAVGAPLRACRIKVRLKEQSMDQGWDEQALYCSTAVFGFSCQSLADERISDAS